MIPEHYRDFCNIFDEATFSTLPERQPYNHAIELYSDAKLYCGKIDPMTQDKQQALDAFLEENLLTGQIHLLKSPWGALFFFVKKKDSKLCPVQDYRQLNTLTKKNVYHLPLIQEILDWLKDTQYYTKLDICWGYNNI